MPSSSKSKLSATAVCFLSLGAVACSATPPAENADDSGWSRLETKDHRAISGDACRNIGMPDSFCLRVEQEAFNVDRSEWDKLSAHAQRELDQSACDAAAEVQGRLHAIGGEVREILAAGSPSPESVSHLARALGRSLHTIQDNCAHSGMTNPQHAWLSDRDICVAPGENPDTQPEALACAREESAVIMTTFREALVASKIDPNALSAATEIIMHNPTRSQACRFVQGWQKFDGVDTRWNTTKTRDAFRTTLLDAFVTDQPPAELCAGDDAALASATLREKVEVTNPSCPGLSIFCFGM